MQNADESSSSSEEGRRPAWHERCVAGVCCHARGGPWCRRHSRGRRCVKCFFKTCAVGQINNGLYFGRSQQYLSVLSGILTLLGALVLIVLSVKVFIDIFNYSSIQSKLEYQSFDIKRY